MSSRAGSVKLKSINRFSTALPGAVAVAVAVALGALAGGCAGEGPGSMVGTNLLLTPPARPVTLGPGQTGSVSFALTSDGVPLGGQKVTFAIIDTGTSASLAGTDAVTDANGLAIAVVHAVLEEEFTVRATLNMATLNMATADAFVVVSTGTPGDVLVAPFFAPSSTAAAQATTIDVQFFRGLRCQDLVPAHPSGKARPPVPPLPGSGGTTEFDAVPTDGTSAIVARALDRETSPIATGCVDLAGSTLLPGGLVEVAVPLYDTVTDPVGTFNVFTPLVFSPPLTAAGAIAAPWRDLADCPLDPAQLWLDCTIDALSPATAADPLDCIPIGAPGAEGPVGDALSARRGTTVTNADGTPSGCRSARDAGGAVSLEAVLLGLFGSPLPPPIVALPAVAYDAAHILDRVTLHSTLDVSAGDRPDRFVVTHTLLSARFVGSVAETLLLPLGLPVLSAYATATTQDQQIFIANHGFTLRLGTVTRAAFGTIVLVPRGLPADPGEVPAALTDLAHLNDGVTIGCAAMDETLCPLVGLGPGCLRAACEQGTAVLGAQLDASFGPADGEGLDLYLAGSAVLIDQSGSGITRVLGDSADMSKVAAWTVDLRTRLGRSTLGASFNGARK